MLELKDQKVCCEILSPTNDRTASPMIPQQYGYLNKTRTKIIQIDTLMQKEVISCPYSLPSQTKNCRQLKNA